MKNIFAALLSAGALAAVAQNAALEHPGATAGATGWDFEPAILARIKAPQFPARDASRSGPPGGQNPIALSLSSHAGAACAAFNRLSRDQFPV